MALIPIADIKAINFILLISISGNIFAQSEPQNLLDSFFKTYEKDAGKAVKDLYATKLLGASLKLTSSSKIMLSPKKPIFRLVSTKQPRISRILANPPSRLLRKPQKTAVKCKPRLPK